MTKKLWLFSLIVLPFAVSAQSYNDNLLQWREGFIQSLLRGNHPLKAVDTQYLDFFKPDADYRVVANFVPVSGARPFYLKTANGSNQLEVREYGKAEFELMSTSLILHIYSIVKDGGSKEYNLLIPFTDPTNGKQTFRGGRYLDVTADDIKDDKVVIDFNKCYNPHSAYEKGYPYFLAPPANNLSLDINAGEKKFGIDPPF
jgi:uncharacterized protein (DUF1684 family)